MTPSTAKNYLPLIQAMVDGKQLQKLSGGKWYDFLPHSSINWSGQPEEYRIKPTPTLRPWKPEEFVFTPIKHKNGDSVYFPIYKDDEGVVIRFKNIVVDGFGETHEKWEKLAQWYLYTTDNGATWLPCGVAE
jgi:hypothetical protein